MDYASSSMLFDFREPLPTEEITKYFLKYKSGDKQARETIIYYNMRFVYCIALKYAITRQDIEEFFSIGLIGLIKAVDTFDIEKKLQFSTYSFRCISNEILMFLRKRKKQKTEISLEVPIFTSNEGKEWSIEEILASSELDITEAYEKKEYLRAIKEIVYQLPDKEKEIICLFFGFYNDKCYTQSEIAKRFNLSQSFISRIIKRTLIQLKEKIENQNSLSIKEIQPTTEEINSILKQDYQKAVLLLQEPSYVEMFSSFTTKQAFILLLKLGFVEGKQYSNQILSKFFAIKEYEIENLSKELEEKQKTYRK